MTHETTISSFTLPPELNSSLDGLYRALASGDQWDIRLAAREMRRCLEWDMGLTGAEQDRAMEILIMRCHHEAGR